MAKYNIYNPATARRVIHNGLAESRSIEIPPHSSKEGVELADHVALELMERADKIAGELQLTQVSEAEEAPINPSTGLPPMKMAIKDELVSVIKAEPEADAEPETPKKGGKRS